MTDDKPTEREIVAALRELANRCGCVAPLKQMVPMDSVLQVRAAGKFMAAYERATDILKRLDA